MGQDAGIDEAGVGEARQQQRIGPGQNAGRHAGDRAARGRAPPDQAAEKGGSELGHGRKGQQPDRGELGVAGRAVIQIGEQQDREDGEPAHGEQQRSDVGGSGHIGFAALEHHRHHDVIRHHDGERDRFDDHHRGAGRETAHEGDDRQDVGTGDERQRQNIHVAVDLVGRKGQQAGDRDRDHEQVDQHEIEREQPGGAPDLVLVVVFDHGDVELARKQQDREQRQQRHHREGPEIRRARQDGAGLRMFDRPGEERGRPVEHREGHEYADRQERDQLDERFRRDRQDQPVLVLGRVDMARAEQHREGRHRERDQQRDIAEDRLDDAGTGGERAQHGGERARHRFELERDIGNGADDRDQGHQRRHALVLAVTRRDEIGDRGDVLRLGEAHDPNEQRRGERDHQHRPDIDREKVVAGARRQADRPEEGPGRAVDRQRQRIDQQARAALAPEQAHPVAIARHHEQEPDIGQRNGDDDPALQHAGSCATWANDGGFFTPVPDTSPRPAGLVHRPAALTCRRAAGLAPIDTRQPANLRVCIAARHVELRLT